MGNNISVLFSYRDDEGKRQSTKVELPASRVADQTVSEAYETLEQVGTNLLGFIPSKIRVTFGE